MAGAEVVAGGSRAQCRGQTQSLSYLQTAEVAGILHVSPKTVSRWAKEGTPLPEDARRHRRYPQAKLRELANQLHEQAPA